MPAATRTVSPLIAASIPFWIEEKGDDDEPMVLPDELAICAECGEEAEDRPDLEYLRTDPIRRSPMPTGTCSTPGCGRLAPRWKCQHRDCERMVCFPCFKRRTLRCYVHTAQPEDTSVEHQVEQVMNEATYEPRCLSCGLQGHWRVRHPSLDDDEQQADPAGDSPPEATIDLTA